MEAFKMCLNPKAEEQHAAITEDVRVLVKVGPETRNNSRNRMLRAAPYLTVYVGVIVEQLGLPSPGSNGILSGKLREAFDTAVSHTARKRHPGDILTESLDYLAVILKHPGVKKCFSRDFLQLLANFSANVRAALIPEDIILSFKETKHFQITNKLAKAAQGLLGVYEKCAEVDSAIDVLVRHAYNLPRETEGDGIMDIAFNCLVRFNDQKSVDWNNVHHWAAPLLFAILFRDRVRGSSIEGLRKLKIADPTNAPRTMQLPPLPGTAVESYLFSEETAYGVAESFQLLHFEPSEIASKEQLVRIRKLIDCLHILCREYEQDPSRFEETETPKDWFRLDQIRGEQAKAEKNLDAYIQNDRNPRVLANLLKSDLTMLDKGVVMETVRRAIMERVIVEVTPSNTGKPNYDVHFKDGQADIRRCLILLSLHPDRGDIWRRLATLVSAIVDIETPRNPNSIMADRQMVFDYISQVLNVEVAEARAPKDPDATLEEWKHEFEPWKKVLSLLLAEEAARQKKAAALLAVQGPAPTRTVSLKSSVSTAMLPGGV